MAAKQLFHRKVVLADSTIVEMVIWQLPERSGERPRGLKYRLYAGTANGTCLVRYDNERGKGDHKHIGDREQPYAFVDVERLIADFLADLAQQRSAR